jgi:ribonuclease PH
MSNEVDHTKYITAGIVLAACALMFLTAYGCHQVTTQNIAVSRDEAATAQACINAGGIYLRTSRDCIRAGDTVIHVPAKAE